jgi:uncharacterized protein YggE
MRMLIAAGVVLAAGVAGAQEPPIVPGQPPVIVTSGDATVRRTPDRAFVTIAVDARARNPRDAQKQAADAMTAIQQRLGQARLGQDAVRTLAYNLEQEFDVAPNGRTPRDYLATNTIEVRLDDITRVGEIIDSVVRGGATSVAGVRFEIQNRVAAEQEALKLAVADARSRADAAAAGAGLKVDKVLRIEDRRDSIGPVPRPMMMAARSADAATPIEPGLIEIRAHVSLMVSIK